MPRLDRLTRLRLATALTHGGAGFLRRFYPALAWSGGYFALLLLNLTTLVGDEITPLLARAFYLVLAVLIWRGIAPKRELTRARIDRLLEQRAGIDHRPLQLLKDQPFGLHNEPRTTLWQQAKMRASEQVKAITSPSYPPPFFPVIDPYGTRFALLLALIVGVLFAAGDSADRITSGLSPFAATTARDTKSSIALLTVTPPPYTAWPDFTAGQKKEATNTPRDATSARLPLIAGTTLHAQTSAGLFPSLLLVGWHPYVLRRDDHHQLSRTLILERSQMPHHGTIALWQGFSRVARLSFVRYDDTPPQLKAGTAPPAPNGRGLLRVPVMVSDDFGIEQIDVTLTPLMTDTPPRVLARTEKITQPFLTAPAKTLQPVAIDLDLGDSFGAGTDMQLTLRVKDHLGQAAELPPQIVHLPERAFHTALARQLIALRRDLIAQGIAADERVAQALEILLARPQGLPRDPTTILSLRVGAERLQAPLLSDDDRRAVAALLWYAALRADDGGASLQEALTKVRQAQQKLTDLLTRDDLSEGELDAALQDMAQALSASLQALMQRMAGQSIDPRLQDMLSQFPDLQQQVFDPGQLGDLLRQLRADIKAGNRDRARDMLERLQKMMTQMGNAQSTLPQELSNLMDLIDDLQRILTSERSLRQKTDQADDKALPALTKDQTATANDLQTVIKDLESRLPLLPPNFDNAHDAMTKAANALRQADRIEALAQEDRAIHELDTQQQQSAQQLMAMMRQMVMFPRIGGALSQGAEGDPSTGQNLNSQTIDIPEQTRARLRSILQKLRDQNTQSLPREERQYFERLLRPY